MKKLEDIKYAAKDASQELDIYLPDTPASCVFVYFHGGGLEAGDKKSAHKMAEYLTSHSIAVISANYRMYPHAEYPTFIYDAAEAVAFAHRYMKEQLNCTDLYVGGSSAGGYLSMMLCFDCRYLSSVGLDNSYISGYYHDAGQPTAHFNVLKHKGVDPRRIIVDETSPLYYVGIEKEYPPMRFAVSDNDMKNRYEQTMLMLSTLSHFGYEGYDHIVINGKHCEYCHKTDEHGESIFGRMIYEFILKCEQ